MSKYTRFTTKKSTPLTVQLDNGNTVTFLTKEYTTDNKEEIEALISIANTPGGAVKYDPKAPKVDYQTNRDRKSNQNITLASTGIQPSISTTLQRNEREAPKIASAVTRTTETQLFRPEPSVVGVTVTPVEAANIIKSIAPTAQTKPKPAQITPTETT